MKLYAYVYNFGDLMVDSFDIEAEYREETKFGAGYLLSRVEKLGVSRMPFPYNKSFIGKNYIDHPFLLTFTGYCALYTKPDISQFVECVISEIKKDIDKKSNSLNFLLSYNDTYQNAKTEDSK